MIHEGFLRIFVSFFRFFVNFLRFLDGFLRIFENFTGSFFFVIFRVGKAKCSKRLTILKNLAGTP
jgi:hypothetical protein